MQTGPVMDAEQCYRVVQSRDPRFDGWFFTAVTSTGIYCRPSCPAVTPKRFNVVFHPSAAAAQGAGFRACKRCRPDAAPGSPQWNGRADLVGRAMRLIADGLVDRDGVAGLASRLGYSERQLHRALVAEVGAGPQALARAQRAQTARLLLETTDLPVSQVALAAGFSSLRQYNDTIRAVFASTPTGLRSAPNRSTPAAPGMIALRLPYREPMELAALLAFLGARAVPGVEEYDGRSYRRTLRLPHGAGIAALQPSSASSAHVSCTLWLEDLRDLAAAVQRCRRLLDLDADPLAVDAHLGADALLEPLIIKAPGRRSAGTVDGDELAVRAVLGQQVSLGAARTLAARLTTRFGTPLPAPSGALTHLFPAMDTLAGIEPAQLPMPRSRATALLALAREVAGGGLRLDPGVDRTETERRLLRLPGIGAWTAGYIRMRALGDPDAFLATDLGLRRAVARIEPSVDAGEIVGRAHRWSPWRAYAMHHLWAS